MKKPIERRSGDDMRQEYDFASMKGGVRGKYYEQYRSDRALKTASAVSKRRHSR